MICSHSLKFGCVLLTAEYKKTLLSRDLKYSLFDLFASWSGKFSHTFSALDKRLVVKACDTCLQLFCVIYVVSMFYI